MPRRLPLDSDKDFHFCARAAWVLRCSVAYSGSHLSMSLRDVCPRLKATASKMVMTIEPTLATLKTRNAEGFR